MKLEEGRKARRVVVATMFLVLLGLAVAIFVAYFFGRWLAGS